MLIFALRLAMKLIQTYFFHHKPPPPSPSSQAFSCLWLDWVMPRVYFNFPLSLVLYVTNACVHLLIYLNTSIHHFGTIEVPPHSQISTDISCSIYCALVVDRTAGSVQNYDYSFTLEGGGAKLYFKDLYIRNDCKSVLKFLKRIIDFYQVLIYSYFRIIG